jgi:hypothetical protein
VQDAELMDRVGGRLYARCLDVVATSDSLVRCQRCHTMFEVRNLVEGRPRQVLATLDALAAGRG